jgi:hypothetical protein
MPPNFTICRQGSLTPNTTKLSVFQPLSPVIHSKRRRSPIRSPTLPYFHAVADRSQTRTHIRSRAIKNVFWILLSIRSFMSTIRVRNLRPARFREPRPLVGLRLRSRHDVLGALEPIAGLLVKNCGRGDLELENRFRACYSLVVRRDEV